MRIRSVLSGFVLGLAGIAMSGCVDEPRAYHRPGLVVVDRDRDYRRYGQYDRYDRYERYDRRDYRDDNYRDYRRARRDDFCSQYPADPVCFGRRY